MNAYRTKNIKSDEYSQIDQSEIIQYPGYRKAELKQQKVKTNTKKKRIKSKTSVVWKYFNHTSDQKVKICQICSYLCVSYSKNTGYLLQHLRKAHPDILPNDPDFKLKVRRKKEAIISHEQHVYAYQNYDSDAYEPEKSVSDIVPEYNFIDNPQFLKPLEDSQSISNNIITTNHSDQSLISCNNNKINSQYEQILKIVNKLEQQTRKSMSLSQIQQTPKIFDIKLKNQTIFCHLCHCLFYYEQKGLEQFKIHVQKIHFPQLQNQQNNQNIKLQLEQQLSNSKPLTLHDILLQSPNNKTAILNHFADQFKSLNIQLQVIIKQSQTQENVFSTRYILILKKEPEDKLAKNLYQNISLWYAKKPMKQLKMYSAIYIITQNSKLKPCLQGIILLLQENEETYRLIIEELHKKLKIFKTANPSQKMIVCGTTLFQKVVQDYLSSKVYIQNHIKPPISVVIKLSDQMISSNTNENQIKQTIYTIIQKILAFQSQNCNFIGFFLSIGYISGIIKCLQSIHKKLDSFDDFIFQLFGQKFEMIKQNRSKNKDLVNYINSQTNNDEALNNMKDKLVSKEIFEKYAVTYMYSQVFTCKEINSKFYEISISDCSHEVVPFQVVYNLSTKKWKCMCGLNRISGLPCPHIHCLVSHLGQPIQNFIDPKWIQLIPKIQRFAILKYLRTFPKRNNTIPLKITEQQFFDFLIA